MTLATQTRLWYWNQAGAHSLLCSPEDVEATRRRLISEGAVVWATEVLTIKKPPLTEEALSA